MVDLASLATAVAEARTKALASIVASLINENEPLLVAEAEGTAVMVKERGGHDRWRITVDAVERG